VLRALISISLISIIIACIDRSIAPVSNDTYKPDQLLVRFKPQISREEVNKINNSFECKVIRYMANQNLYLIEIPKDTSIEDMINKYLQIPEVEYAEPNYLIKLP
jgi:hypothetical protein